MEEMRDSESKGGGNKECDPVRSQTQVPDIELRRMGEAKEKITCCVWYPTATFGVSWIDGWVESMLVADQGIEIP